MGLRKSAEELTREAQLRDLRKEQIVGAFYGGIGTGIGVAVAGLILSVVAKLTGLY